MDSTQKVVVVTGASGGIGAAAVAGHRGLGYAVTATGLAIQPSADPEVLAVSSDVSPALGLRLYPRSQLVGQRCACT
jgi:NAD(P)-dependent dehydrogenase (short-subunit alcohol dehydrogenase family)